MTSQAASQIEPALTFIGRVASLAHRRRVEIWLFLLSLAVRACLLPWAPSLKLVGDEAYYWKNVALSVAQGSFLTIGQQLRPPLWGYILALPALVSSNPFAGRLFAVLLSSLTAIFVYLIGARVFDRRTGVVAGAVFALYPEHVYYSHYLWSEPFFGLLLAITAWVYLKSIGSPNGASPSPPDTSSRIAVPPLAGVPLASSGLRQAAGMRRVSQRIDSVTASFLLCGIALLAKEFAAIFFVSMLIQLPRVYPIQRLRLVAKNCAWFLLPVTLYCLMSWAHTGKLVLLSRMPVGNLLETVPLDIAAPRPPEYSDLGLFVRAFVRKTPHQHLKTLEDNATRLWSQNSLPVVRLLGGRGGYPERKNRIPLRLTQAVGIGAAHVIIMIAGLLGLIACPNKVFQRFTAANLVLLTVPVLFAHVVSRYRLPFFFLVILCACYALVHFDEVRQRLKDWKLKIMAIVLLFILALIVLNAWGRFGIWG